MKGYKAFNQDLTCLDYQFKEDVINVYDGIPVLYESGFHFCTELKDILKYYCHTGMRLFEIEASGIITESDDAYSKRSCSEIRLIKELDLKLLRDTINTSEYAYLWAINWPEDKDLMRPLITESEEALLWAKQWPEDRDLMRPLVTDIENTYYWVITWPEDRDLMESILDVKVKKYLLYIHNMLYKLKTKIKSKFS